MAHLRSQDDMGDDYEIERKIIETLIAPVIEVYDSGCYTIFRFDPDRPVGNFGGRYVVKGEVSLVGGCLFHPCPDSVIGSGWCYVPQIYPVTWPPCSFAEFVQRLNDPETRKKHGLPPL